MKRADTGSLVIAVLGTCFFSFPLVWMFLTAVRPPAELWAIPPWLPSRIDWTSFKAVLESDGYLRSLGNSAMLGPWVTAMVLSLSAPAAYALARGLTQRREALMGGMLVLSLLPPICLVGGLYKLYAQLGWLNHLAALALPLAALELPFAVWMLVPVFARVPKELEEAAWIDGCSRWRGFVRIILPAAGGGLASAALIALAFTWNEFLFGFSLTFDSSARPVTVAAALFQGAYHQPWGELCAAAVISALPMGLLALVLQRRLISGLSAGFGKED